MIAADNRHASNLLLLCLLHASEIDTFPERYPADTLRARKRIQIEEYERAHKSWQITDAEHGKQPNPSQGRLASSDGVVAIDAVATHSRPG